MKLTVKWDEFSNQLDTFISEGKLFLTFENSTQIEQDFEKTKSEIKVWEEKCFDFLKSSFENNRFSILFHNAKQERYNLGNHKKEFRQIKAETFQDFKEKFNALVYIKRILSISDLIIKPEIVELNDRNLYTTEQTIELLLDKLYDLYDNSYYSISTILEGNGITQKRHGEDRELLKMLEESGFVTATYLRDSLGQLTLKGKRHVEDKRKSHTENYSEINRSQAEINDRIDEIIEKLTKLGYGQEIIFIEIQELKELYTKLNKKNWAQVVKGKIVDLALSKLVENDTLNYIYDNLTGHTLRLP